MIPDVGLFRIPSFFRRTVGLSIPTVAFVLATALPLAAQDPDPFARLEPNVRFSIELLMDSAASSGLPAQALRSMALQGIAKKADGKDILRAVHKEFILLRVAHATLGSVDAGELSAAAAVLQAGAKQNQLAAFKGRQKGRNDLEAFTVWADLITRGVPSEDASSAITKLWQDGADDETFLSLWKNVQSDILQGLNPGAALQNRIRETPTPGRTPPKVSPPAGQQENQSSR